MLAMWIRGAEEAEYIEEQNSQAKVRRDEKWERERERERGQSWVSVSAPLRYLLTLVPVFFQ